MSKPKLISFKICPFVQRAVILLKEKGVDYDIEYIDVYDPPEWFVKLSPTGKVPVLQVGDEVLFESAVISEYIEEVYPPALHPADPIQKAKNRAWMEYTSPLYMGTFNFLMAKTEEDANTAKAEMSKQLAGLDSAKTRQPWFNGDAFSLIDIAAAPFFVRAAFFKEHCDVDLLEKFPNMQKWSDDILARQSVIDSKVEGFDNMLLKRMESNESFIKKA